MADRVMLTDKGLRGIKPAPKGKRVEIWDVAVPNFGIRVTDSGNKTFIVMRRVAGKLIRHTIGGFPAISLSDAREQAREALRLMSEGKNPTELRAAAHAQPDPESPPRLFKEIAESFIERHIEKNNRNAKEGIRIVRTYLIPRFGKMRIEDITRCQIAELMDEVEAHRFKGENGKILGGEVMADRVLGRLSKLMNWHATRDDHFVSPIVKGMKRANEKERARTRVLSDDEIRAFWKVAGRAVHPSGDNVFGAMCKVLLLTAQRRAAVGRMLRSEIDDRGIWTIPRTRDKSGKERKVPLPAAALEIISGMETINGSDIVFTTTGDAPLSGYSQSKRFLDLAMLAEMRIRAAERQDEAAVKWVQEMEALLSAAHAGDMAAKKAVNKKWWRLHDLRRTAKTLMARAGVRPDISERVLGHEIVGVEGVYDRWDYLAEKRDALDRLQAIITKILSGGAGADVVFLHGKKA